MTAPKKSQQSPAVLTFRSKLNDIAQDYEALEAEVHRLRQSSVACHDTGKNIGFVSELSEFSNGIGSSQTNALRFAGDGFAAPAPELEESFVTEPIVAHEMPAASIGISPMQRVVSDRHSVAEDRKSVHIVEQDRKSVYSVAEDRTSVHAAIIETSQVVEAPARVARPTMRARKTVYGQYKDNPVSWWTAMTIGLLNEDMKTPVVINPLWEAAASRGKVNFDGARLIADFTIQTVKTKFEKKSWLREKVKQYVPMHPTCAKKMLWDVISMFLLVHDFIMFPMSAFPLPKEYLSAIKQYEGIAAWFWSCDIILSFLTCYYSSMGTLVTDLNKVAKHYLKTYFGPDFIITTLDWSVVLYAVDDMSFARIFFRIARGVRLLRLNKVLSKMSELIGTCSTETIIAVFSIVKLLGFVTLASHYTACLWYLVARVNSEGKTWWTNALDENHSMSYAYATSLHWALTQFTPASMEVVPVNTWERIYVCSVIVTALVVFSSFVSSITQAMTTIRQINAAQLQQESLIRRFLTQRDITTDLCGRIWHFVKRHKLTTKGHLKEADIKVFKMLPWYLRQELRSQAYEPKIRAHPLFNLFKHCEKDTMLEICGEAIVEQHVTEGNEVVQRGAIVDDLVFVSSGHLEYATDPPWNRDVVQSTPGSWLCEVGLWGNDARLHGMLSAGDRGCDVVLVKGIEFRSVLKRSPRALPLAASYAVAFVERFKAASFDETWEDILFNGMALIEDILFETVCEDYPYYLAVLTKLGYSAVFQQMATSRAGRDQSWSTRSPSEKAPEKPSIFLAAVSNLRKSAA